MKDGGYHLNPSIVSVNGTFSKRNGNGKMNPTILHIKKNVQWIPAALIVCLVVVAFGSAMMVAPPAPAPAPTTADFYYTPSWNIAPRCNLTFVSHSRGSITDYYWNFGDDSPIAYGKIVTHNYVAAGTYIVTLSVRDAHGSTASTQETVTVPNAPINFTPINFTILPNPILKTAGWENKWIVNKTLTFNAPEFNESCGYTPNYSWSFGDGVMSTGAVVSHAYQQEGNYSVILTALDPEGNEQSITLQVQILPMPITKIYVEPLPIQYQVGDVITLNIMVSNVNDLWSWQAGITFNQLVLQPITTPNPSNAPPNVTCSNTAFTEGDFLKRGGSTVWIPNWVTNGTITPSGCSLLSPATPQSGNGTLATVTFKVIGEGNLDIHLVNVLLLEINTSEIPVNVAT
jgi:PKD repeat protein